MEEKISKLLHFGCVFGHDIWKTALIIKQKVLMDRLIKTNTLPPKRNSLQPNSTFFVSSSHSHCITLPSCSPDDQ